MQIITGGVTSPKGFSAAAAAAQIKYKDRADMAMIVSEVPAVCAGTFTTNLVKAAPVLWDKQIVQEKTNAKAIVINAGIANACTGKQGMDYCRETAEEAAGCLIADPSEILVASTGVIGYQLPMDRIRNGIRILSGKLSSTPEAAHEAACAIMTTDTHPKETAVTCMIGGKTVTVAGMCKGSGMIHPDMCTMLSFVTTDAAITKELLCEALAEDVKDTYNMISVDGDTSTNDTVLVLANGMAENALIDQKDEKYHIFCRALRQVNETLARMMAGDGEGATALFEVTVTGASSKEQAKILAKSVVCSSLTKAAIFGHDANWGRILCAMGYAGAAFDPDKVELFFESAAGRIRILEGGIACDYSEEEATRILSQTEVRAVCDLHEGDQTATAWGCDLTYDYVRINADYRS